jgi:hypothetical protein
MLLPQILARLRRASPKNERSQHDDLRSPIGPFRGDTGFVRRCNPSSQCPLLEQIHTQIALRQTNQPGKGHFWSGCAIVRPEYFLRTILVRKPYIGKSHAVAVLRVHASDPAHGGVAESTTFNGQVSMERISIRSTPKSICQDRQIGVYRLPKRRSGSIWARILENVSPDTRNFTLHPTSDSLDLNMPVVWREHSPQMHFASRLALLGLWCATINTTSATPSRVLLENA